MIYKNLTKALKEKNQVQILYLEWNESHFPESLMEFPHLSELMLKAPQVSSPLLAKLFALNGLKNLKLIDLNLSEIELSIPGPSDLIFLTLKNCRLPKLPKQLHFFHQLQEWNLAENNLSELPHEVKMLKKLKRLNLDQNQFKIFPKIIKEIPSLKHLSLDGNLFSDEEKERIQREYFINVK